MNPKRNHGYIDPSVGLLVLQGIIASAVGGLFFARRIVYQFMAKYLGKGPKPAPAADAEPKS